MASRRALFLFATLALAVGCSCWFLLGSPEWAEIEHVVQAAPGASSSGTAVELASPNPSEVQGRSTVPASGAFASVEIAVWSAKPTRPTDPRVLEGRVVGADDQPVELARVMLWPDEVLTSKDGSFQFRLPSWLSEDARLFAVKQGFQPASISIAEQLALADPPPLVLRLGPETLSISGVVLQSDGYPASGWTVELTDGTEVSQGKWPNLLLEDLATRTASVDGRHPSARSGQDLLSNKVEDAHVSTQTGPQGEFTLSGLSMRAYGLRAVRGHSSARADAVVAGTIGLVLRADAVMTDVRGVVVDRRGAPVASVALQVQFCTLRTATATNWSSDPPATSSERGEFVLASLPWRDARLRISGDDIVEKTIDVRELQLGSELRISVERLREVRFFSIREPAPTRVIVLDDRGGWLSETRLGSPTFVRWSGTIPVRPRTRFSGEDDPFGAESSEDTWRGLRSFEEDSGSSLRVSELARTLVLMQGESELARYPLDFELDQVPEIRY